LPDVLLPSLGESVTEGMVTRWFKNVGDRVERDEPLYEISTDKVDSEMPSPAAGVLTEILKEEGDTVAVGERLAFISDGASAASRTTPAPESATPPAAAVTVAAPEPEAGTAAPAPSPSVASAGENTVTSPVVRRILEDAGLDAARVPGTGPRGTVTRRDAEQAVLQQPVESVVVPVSNARRRMAEHMSASVATSPQAFVAIEADATALRRLRELGDITHDGVHVEPSTVVALAVVRALGEFELLNATLTDEGMVLHQGVNLGVVLGLDDGMVVPVVHAAGGLTLRSLSRRVADLKERTETRQLTTDDLMDATITIAGAPSEHVLFSVPILIQPQVAIISVGASSSHLELSEGTVVSTERVVIGCSFDHRVVDATYVARFLDRVAGLLSGLDIDTER
jgi:2-oxoglutarate dehydrogenase E2 component (dihydrolipoamide succinyltransferase)